VVALNTNNHATNPRKYPRNIADGAVFIDLAPLRDPTLVGTAVVQALGFKEVSAQPLLETLQVWLRDRHLLVLLDNFERAPPSSGTWRRCGAHGAGGGLRPGVRDKPRPAAGAGHRRGQADRRAGHPRWSDGALNAACKAHGTAVMVCALP
jgi:hypothetical protein